MDLRFGSKNTKRRGLGMIAGITLLVLLLANNATAKNLTVCQTGCNYSIIQAAVDAAHPADTIIVMDGKYIENINVNIPHLTIRSENGSASTYIIASGSNKNVFEVTADYLNLSGFTIKGAIGDCYWRTGVGIQLNKSKYSAISKNNLIDNDCGINIISSQYNNISYNNVAKNDWVGIRLFSSENNMINNNNIIFNYANILLYQLSNNNIIEDNNAIGSTDWDGISIDGSNSNRVTNNKIISNHWNGISLSDSSYNIIENNNVSSNGGSGFDIYSGNNVIANNTVESNQYYGINIYYLGNNSIDNNSVNSNNIGIELSDSPRNIITGNKMSSNKLENIDIYSLYGLDGYIQFFDISNTEEGRPIYYVVNANDTEYNSSTNAAFFVCILCNNITVKDLNITSKSESLHFIMTEHSKIENITFNDNYPTAIHIYSSDNNIIENNTIYNKSIGILVDASFASFSENNTITKNNLINNNAGISIQWSDYNIISNNNISSSKGSAIGLDNSYKNNISQNTLSSNFKAIVINRQSDKNMVADNNISFNENGITLLDSYTNIIYHNVMNANTKHASDNHPDRNFWNHPDELEGNYWSDYSGSDDGSGTGKHDFSGDHIGDTLIPHPSAGYDFYPYIYENGWMRPTIIVYTDKTNYMTGDVMKVGMNITNPGSVTKLALDIWIDLPDGGIKVVISNASITLPAGLDYKKYPFLSTTLPGIQPGNYTWHEILRNTTSGSIISESISPWTFGGAITGTESQEELEKTFNGVPLEIDFINESDYE